MDMPCAFIVSLISLNAGPRGFDTQRALSLHDVVGGGVRPFDALDSHDSLQVDPLDDEVVLATTHVVYDGSGHARNALHDDVGNSRAQRLQVEQGAPIRGGALRGVGFSLGLLVGGQHVQQVVAGVKHVVSLELQLWRREQRVSNRLGRDVELQHGDDLGVDAHLQVARGRVEHHVDKLANLAQRRLLHAAFHHPRRLDVVVALEARGDDRG